MADNIARVCAKAEIAPDSVKAFEVGDKRLAVFNIGGRYYVTDDECTHASASLADGMLDGEVIECAVHMGAFHVPTREVKAPPCAVALRTYKVVLNGDDVLSISTGMPPANWHEMNRFRQAASRIIKTYY